MWQVAVAEVQVRGKNTQDLSSLGTGTLSLPSFSVDQGKLQCHLYFKGWGNRFHLLSQKNCRVTCDFNAGKDEK